MIKLAIIGGGPAGLSSAIYASRAYLDPVVFAPAGGQLTLSNEVGNFPGFPDEITGFELIDRMHKQAEKFGTKFVTKNVDKVDFFKRPFKIWTGNEEHEAEAVIIATGSSARWLGIPGEFQMRGKGISACATCDGFFFKNKKVVVVGGGDTAIEDALFLTRFAAGVSVIHRRDELRAKEYLQKRAFDNPKIKFLWNSEVKEVGIADRLEKIRVWNNKDNTESWLETEGVFVAVGHQPNTKFLEGQIELDEAGYIVKHDLTKTSVEGVFVAGDVSDPKYMQASVAAGFGVMAELDAERWLQEVKS